MSHPQPLPIDAVTADVALHCLDQWGRPLAFMATWSYRPGDPYAVGVTFHVPSGDIAWLIGRPLLGAGLVGPAGIGDVRLAPDRDDDGEPALAMEFRTGAGRLMVRAMTTDVEEFLAATYCLVPDGTESDHLDLDATVAGLLAE